VVPIPGEARFYDAVIDVGDRLGYNLAALADALPEQQTAETKAAEDAAWHRANFANHIARSCGVPLWYLYR
jgi:hypothetical protein